MKSLYYQATLAVVDSIKERFLLKERLDRKLTLILNPNPNPKNHSPRSSFSVLILYNRLG